MLACLACLFSLWLTALSPVTSQPNPSPTGEETAHTTESHVTNPTHSREEIKPTGQSSFTGRYTTTYWRPHITSSYNFKSVTDVPWENMRGNFS